MHVTFVLKNFNVTHFTSLHFTSKQKSFHTYHISSPHITTLHITSLILKWKIIACFLLCNCWINTYIELFWLELKLCKHHLPYFVAHKTHFFSRKMWPKFDLRLIRRGYVKMTFYMKKVTHRVKTTMEMILVALTKIFWVSIMNKLYYGC